MTEQLPDRTLFYSLHPKGLGTPFVEGQTGYIRRLARAHRVKVADFICHSHFDSLFANPADHRTRQRLFLASGYLLDGAGSNTQRWAEALGAATGQSDIHSLTLSQFGGVSSFSWLRRRRAWCPRCLSIQAKADPDDIYEPLLWSIRLVSACPIDTSPLVQQCPNCQAPTRPFDGLAAPGYCGMCGSPLWAQSAKTPPDLRGSTSYELWCSVHVALLLEASNEFLEPLLPRSVGQVLAATFESMLEQSRSAAANVAGFSKRSSYLWAKGLAVPRIESLFRLCFNLGLSPLDLFRKAKLESAHESSVPAPSSSGTFAATEAAHQLTLNFTIRKPNGRIHYDHASRALEIKNALTLALAQMPPPTLHATARLLKMSSSTSLREVEPVLSQQLDGLRKEWEKTQRSKILATFREAFAKPSLSSSFARFCLQFGFPISFVTREFPDIKTEYVAKYREIKSARRRARADEQRQAVENAVNIICANGEYPSVGRVKAQSEKLCSVGWDEIQAHIRNYLAPQ